jgi:hypothetical protein
LAQAGYSMLVTPERLPKKELKVQNMNKSPPEYCQPEPQHNSEQKADVYSFSPACANALVVCSCR